MASPYSSDGSDSYDSDEHVDATVNQAPLAASGYNYGEPGMQHNGSDDSDDDDDDDDESMSDEDNNSTSRPAEAATPPRGKTFRLPTGGNDSSSSDDDEPVVRPSPIAPRGKELRLTKKVMGADESSSSDDEALITKRSTKQKANGATPSKSSSAGVKKSNNSSASKKKAATPASSKKKNAAAKKDASKPAARIKVKAKSPSGGSKKRKEPPPPAPSDSESDSDDDDVVAAVVVEGSDSDDEVLAVAEPIKSNKRVKTKDGAPKKSKISSKKSPSGGSTPSAKKSSKKKSSKAKSSPGNASVVDALPEVPAEKADAAQEARHSLQEAVSRLPYAVSDTHTVRSFGRIKPEYGVVAFDALYSSPHAIYPVGFSCDRFEFSPVHGRIIKVRCDILDGGSLREQREELKKAKERQKEEGKGEPALVEESSQDENDLRNDDNECFGDGPVFRVMWGEGVEDVDPSERSYPFDPYAAPAYVGGDVDAVAVPLSSNGGAPGMPEVGMRVSVRFEKGKMYGGTITKTSTADKSSGKQAARKSSCNISIQYDDGVSEDATYPDPDIYLVPPGCPPIEPGNGVVTEMRGKQVHSVLAKTPLEAWGKTLLSLGLIDDIIYDAALKALHKSREDGLVEARDKIDLVNKNRREARAKEKQRLSRGDGEKEDEKKGDDDVDATSKNDNDKLEEDLREPPSSEEIELLGKLNELENILTKAKQQSKAASANLASMRISSLSPFASNPFLCSDDSLAQEMTWMTAAVKKEKTKMGNTGNRRKIVTPATMMEKSDTFFVPEIERLIEGLTGSEFTPSYVFHANRSAAAAANQAWIHEAKVRHQKEQQKKLEKELKSAKEAEAKANIEREKDLKRKIKQEEFETRKRAKEEEEEQRKKERIEKRLTQLSLQMDDRLFKESCIIRERSIMNFVRGMNKEFNRRRRAAEVVVAHQVERSSSSPSSVNSLTSLVPFREMLPPLSRIYDEEVVRIWDFINSFHDAFSKNASTSSPPSINSLQDAIDCLKDVSCDQEKRTNAVDLVKNIAISLCKVISPSLTKSLASAPQVVVSPETNGSQDFSEGADLSCLPVTEWTWREIARMIIINDVLLDLGYSKMESANILKGYRSGGHPNSKEAKRLKKIEDSPLLMTYQQLENKNERNSPKYRRRMVTACLSVPCTPSVSPSDWLSPLHTIKSSPACSVSFMTDQVVCSLSALRKSPTGSLSPEKTTSYIDDLEKCLAILKRSKSSTSDITEAKQIVHGLLDLTREKQPSWATTQTDAIGSTQLTNQTNLSLEPTRQRMGFLKMYQLSREQYKSLDQSREDYMAAALRLKEDLERKTCDEANEEDDDDDDDEEEGVVSGSKTNNDSSTAEPKGEPEATSKQYPPKQIAETDAFSNKGAYSNETVDKASSKPATANGEECVQVQENNPSIDKSTSSQSAENKDKQPACISTDGAEVPIGAAPPKPVSVSGEECVKVHDKNASVDKFTSSKSEENKDEKPPCNGTDGANPSPEDSGICGTKSDYDFCEDLPHAPDLIRRCLAVIRTLCASNSSDPFIYPVDPQLYPGYYEAVMTPTSLYDIGRFLQEAGKTLSSNHDVLEVETVVAEVGRKVRTIVQNSLCYNSGMNTVNAAEEMIRIFERLFFDWVLAPSRFRPALKDLDDDRCIEHHKSDLTSMVLLCDGCEGKYNMTRLKPPLARVPSGDWYCPRCVAGRCWATVDPRIGRQVLTGALSGTVESCKFIFSENGKPSLLYSIKPVNSGLIEFWQLKDVDDSIVGDPVEPLCCLQALAESPGYGFGRDYGTLLGALPLAINPLVGDNAAQASLSSGAFRDTVSACISLTNPPEDIKAEEWVTLLSLLVMKCSSSDTIQELSSSLETKAAGRLSSELSNFSKAKGAQDMIPDFSEDETVSSEEDASDPPLKATDSAEMKVETKVNDTHSSNKEMSGGEFASENEPSVQKSCEAPNDGNATNVTDIDEPFSIAAPSEEDIFRKKREFAFLSKSRREKKREEALMGFYVGNRLKSTAASFEEDFLSTIVKSTLCTQQHGLDISSVRCKETCHYCGLSDVALGAPLCRVPDDNEWKEAFPHAVHDRFTYMIAEVADPNPSKEDTSNLVNGIKQELKEEKSTKVFTVRVRVGGELVSSKADFIDRPTKNFDSIMQQFLPKNPHAFQSELKFRHESELSFYSGSLTAHEVCAMSAHRSRKNKLLHERRRCHELNIVRESAISCGKSTPIGVDNWGRAYWIFSSDPRSLFICASNKIDRNSGKNKKWHRFHEPEEIASIMVCLGKEPPCDSLKEIFPEAFKLVKDRSWSTLLMDRAYSDENKPQKTLPPSKPSKADQGQIDEDLGPPFVEDEDVLVESANGRILWDAVIVDVCKEQGSDNVSGYLVHYKNWSSRFDQWVPPGRVVEPSENNLLVQKEVLEEFSIHKHATPPMLKGMLALKFLDAKNRARSIPASAPEIYECVHVRQFASHDEKLLGILKGALLLIEAALPLGSIGPSEYGTWNSHTAALWRNLVKNSPGAGSLMKCVLLLEDAISPDWLHPKASYLFSAVTRQWRALSEASLPAIALRVSLLDNGLKYSFVGKSRHR